MEANPVLRRLGFADIDRVVVMHADDIGMCQSTLPAYVAALDFGVLSSAATMAPCPWFPALARLCREHSGDGRVDMGVHLTLNCEWLDYRWGPLSTRDPASGLMAADGGLHRWAREVVASDDLAALEGEMRAQIERAMAERIDLTHIDTHMLTLWHPRLLGPYMRLAFEYGLPLFMMRRAEQMFEAANVAPGAMAETQAQIADAEARGMPFFDVLEVLPLDNAADRLEAGRRALAAAVPGLTNLLIHPAVETPELRAIAPDWRCRVADYELFTSTAWRDAVAASGVKVIGFRMLRDLLRAHGGTSV